MSETEQEIIKRLCSMEAPLNERLAIFSRFVRENALPFAEAYDDLSVRLSSAGAGSTAPEVGDEMPPFALPDWQGRIHGLEDLLARGPVLVSFNRGHWCPYCRVELNAFKQAHREFAANGVQVVSIMPETREYVAKVAADMGPAILVLSDEGNGYALALNLVIWLGERVRSLQGLEFALEKSQGNSAYFVPLPATFVVGSDGRILARHIDPDFRVRMNVEEILALLRRNRT